MTHPNSTHPTRLFLARWQFVLFVALAYILSWWTAPLMGGALLPYGPALAAVVVVGLVAGRVGLAALRRRVTHWRVSWVWYVIALGLPILIGAAALAINLILGASIVETTHLRPLLLLTTVGQLFLFGGLWEEPGWTGYALPYCQERFGGRSRSALPAILIVGAVRSLWHLPLVLAGTIPWYDALFYGLAMQFLIAWLFNRADESVPVVMLFHLASNVVFGGVLIPMFAGADLTRYYGLFIVLTWLVVFLAFRLSGLSRAGGREVADPAQSHNRASDTPA